MGIIYHLTFVCDGCGEEYMVDGENPSMPPYWIGMTMMLSNQTGYIPAHEENHPTSHFCSQECLNEYIKSDEFKERMVLVDVEMEDDEEEDGDEDEEDRENPQETG